MSFKELQESNEESERKYKNCVLLAGRGQVSNVPKRDITNAFQNNLWHYIFGEFTAIICTRLSCSGGGLYRPV